MAQAELIGSCAPHRLQNTVSREQSSLRSGRGSLDTFVRAIPYGTYTLADPIATVSEASDIL
jgi:hypothetical protein